MKYIFKNAACNQGQLRFVIIAKCHQVTMVTNNIYNYMQVTLPKQISVAKAQCLCYLDKLGYIKH